MKNLTKIAIIIIIIGFLVPMSGILMAANCEEKDFDKCLLKKEGLISDFYWHFNSIKYVAAYGVMPYEIDDFNDGGPKGDIIPPGEGKPQFHPPLSYYLSAILYKITKSLLSLHIFSIIMTLFANIVFFFFLKEIAKKIKAKKNFILYSLALFIFLPIQLHTSMMVHPGPFFTPFFAFSLYFFIKAINSLETKYFIWLGLMMGLSMLTALKGFVLPFSLFFYLIILLIRKKYPQIKLFSISLIISILIGSYQFLKNFLIIGSPFGTWRADPHYLTQYEFTRLFDIFTAFWGGIYGGNDFIYPILVVLVFIFTLIIIYSLISSKFWKNSNLDFIFLLGLITIFLMLNKTCRITYILTQLKCIGDITHARYFTPAIPVIAIFPSIIFSKIKNNFLKKLVFLFVLILCILFSIDFLTALLVF